MRVHEYLEHWAGVTPERECVVVGRRRWTYAEAACEAKHFASALRSMGLGRGDRFAVLAKNRIEWLAVYFGASMVGAVPVPLNFRLHPGEWRAVIEDAAPTALLVEERFIDAIERVRPDLVGVERFVSFDAARPGWEALPDRPRETTAATTQSEAPGSASDDALYMMYTSGTTGRPKGAVLSQRAVIANLCQYLPALGVGPGDRALTVMPLFHAGPALTCFTLVAAGVSMQILSDFDAAECVRAMDEDGIVLAVLVPAMLQAMLTDVPEVGDRAYRSLRTVAYGASPIAEATLRRAIETFRCDFMQVYGMTEASGVLTTLSAADHHRALDGRSELLRSCGRPVAGTMVRIVDSAGRDMPPGAVGEIVALGPQLMDGYWGRRQESAEALREGWLHTGDAGHRDDDGLLYISDRVKDMIISGGENIYPREVEAVLFEHPAVSDAAVIGVPDERWGEAVKAVVVPRAGATVTGEELIAFCRERIAAYKRPRFVDLVDELPRNASGKVVKSALRDDHRAAPAGERPARG